MIKDQLLKLLPKKKEEKLKIDPTLETDYALGYNQCLSEITKILEGVEIDEDLLKPIITQAVGYGTVKGQDEDLSLSCADIKTIDDFSQTLSKSDLLKVVEDDN